MDDYEGWWYKPPHWIISYIPITGDIEADSDGNGSGFGVNHEDMCTIHFRINPQTQECTPIYLTKEGQGFSSSPKNFCYKGLDND